MTKPIIYFITTNEFKFKSFTEAIHLDNYEVKRLAVETPEIQADNNRAVAEYSAEWAANMHKHRVISEDVGMYVRALNGFPGPFLSQAEKQLGAEGFLTLLQDKEDRTAYWEYAVAYCEPGKKPVSFHAIQEGTIITEQVGTVGWPMGKIFKQNGQTKTISELLESETYVRNNSHYEMLRDYLSTQV